MIRDENTLATTLRQSRATDGRAHFAKHHGLQEILLRAAIPFLWVSMLAVAIAAFWFY